MPFFGSLHPLGAGSGDHYGTGASRLGFPRLDPVDYQLGAGSAAAAAMGLEPWRLPQMQQFPFFGRADARISSSSKWLAYTRSTPLTRQLRRRDDRRRRRIKQQVPDRQG
ncbi:hypothetical protein ZWY2020_020590 [Hordeum vulgare]|nr:hypothetical protein ZWY2020_020590 [Hordeum vulgare]